MTILLAQPIIYIAGIAIFIVIMAITFKLFFAAQWKMKVKEYQSEIAKSHSRILKLEVQNEKLQQKINDLEGHQSNKKHYLINCVSFKRV
jgi:cell division protein FtsL